MRHMFALLLACLITLPTLAAPPTVSRETTHYLGPLDDEGYVDYVAAINHHFGKNIEPDENAFAGILTRLDPTVFNFTHLAQLYGTLGIKPEADAAKKFVMFDKFAELHDLSRAEFEQQFDAALRSLWSAEQYPHVAAWLEHNKQALGEISDALKRRRYFSPIVLTSGQSLLMAADFQHFGPMRVLARTYMLRADLHFNAGDFSSAVADYVSLRMLAFHLSNEPSQMGSLIGISVFSLADEMLIRWIESAKLDTATIDLLVHHRQNLPPLKPIRESMLDGFELNLALDAVTKLHAGEIGMAELMTSEVIGDRSPEYLEKLNGFYRRLFENEHFNLNLALNIIVRQMEAYPQIQDNETYEAYLERLERAEALVQDHQRIPDEMTEVFLRYLHNHEAGDTRELTETLTHNVSGILLPAVGPAQKSYAKLRIRHNLVDTALRVEKYRAVNHSYPAKLEDLVPEYAERVPMDMADGKPLRYRLLPAGFLLYSVGANLTDEGGEGAGPDDGDIAIRLDRVHR